LLVVDLSDPACAESVQGLVAQLDAKRISLVSDWPARAAAATVDDVDDDERALDPFRIRLPTLLIASMLDLGFAPAALAVLEKLNGPGVPHSGVSAAAGDGLDAIAPFLFGELGLVRVYTKAPGNPPEMDRPFTVRRGATVADVARLVHKDIAAGLKYARIWGTGVFDGQQVGPEHVLHDRDVVELHAR